MTNVLKRRNKSLKEENDENLEILKQWTDLKTTKSASLKVSKTRAFGIENTGWVSK